MIPNESKHVRMGVELAPFALIRVAGLPLRHLERLATPQSSKIVESIVAARSAIERLRPLAEEDLHQLVPTLSERVSRSAAIQLRRDIHTARLPSIESKHMAKILDLLPRGAKANLETWLRTRYQIAQQLEDGQTTLDYETCAQLRPGLWSAVVDQRFSLGIALASPSLRCRLDAEKDRPARSALPTKCEVGLLRYMLRAVCKTSPFSTFMDVGTVAVTDNGSDNFPSLVGARRVTYLQINRGIVARLYNATLRAIAQKDDIQFRPNPTLSGDSGGGIVALVGEQVALLGRPWRQERPARFSIHEEIVNLLLNLPPRFCMSWLIEELTRMGLTSERACHFAGKLLERELILPPAVVDAFAAHPLSDVRESLQGFIAPEAQTVLVSIEELEKLTETAKHVGWEQRINMDRQIRFIEGSTLERLRFRPHEPYRNVFLEDSRIEGIAGSVSGKLCDLVAEVGSFLRDQIVLRPEYVRLRAVFLERFGPFGTCTNLVRFLSEQSASSVNLPEIGAVAKPLPAPGGEIPVNEGVRMGLTAFVQVGWNPSDEDCDDLIVVNRVYEGVGWLSARYSAGSSVEQTNFSELLRRWLHSTYTPAEPVDLPVSGHCNDLQAHTQLTRRVLEWPGEPVRSDRAEVLSARDVALRLNSVTGMLELLDGGGQVVAPVYLGSVLPVPTWGPIFGLTVLGSPMQLLRPSAAAPVEENSDVTFYPRRMHGRVVLTRASWSVRTGYLLKECLGAQRPLLPWHKYSSLRGRQGGKCSGQ